MSWEVLSFVLVAGALSAGCLVPNRWLPPLPNDKFMHFAGFGLLSLLALQIADGVAERALWLFGLLVGGWVIECLQALVPDRAFCWRDMRANTAGIACAAAGAYIVPMLA